MQKDENINTYIIKHIYIYTYIFTYIHIYIFYIYISIYICLYIIMSFRYAMISANNDQWTEKYIKNISRKAI